MRLHDVATLRKGHVEHSPKVQVDILKGGKIYLKKVIYCGVNNFP